VPKNFENWLAVDKVITKIIRLTFLAHPVYRLHALLPDSRPEVCCCVRKLISNRFRFRSFAYRDVTADRTDLEMLGEPKM